MDIGVSMKEMIGIGASWASARDVWCVGLRVHDSIKLQHIGRLDFWRFSLGSFSAVYAFVLFSPINNVACDFHSIQSDKCIMLEQIKLCC